MSASHELCSTKSVKVSSLQTNKQLKHTGLHVLPSVSPSIISVTTDGYPPRTCYWSLYIPDERAGWKQSLLYPNTKLFRCEVYRGPSLCVCVRVCVRVRVYSSSVTQLTDENAFFPPAAIHVLSKCGISYFADLTGLLHTPIRVC